jgi:hypothetical protein
MEFIQSALVNKTSMMKIHEAEGGSTYIVANAIKNGKLETYLLAKMSDGNEQKSDPQIADRTTSSIYYLVMDWIHALLDGDFVAPSVFVNTIRVNIDNKFLFPLKNIVFDYASTLSTWIAMPTFRVIKGKVNGGIYYTFNFDGKILYIDKSAAIRITAAVGIVGRARGFYTAPNDVSVDIYDAVGEIFTLDTGNAERREADIICQDAKMSVTTDDLKTIIEKIMDDATCFEAQATAYSNRFAALN